MNIRYKCQVKNWEISGNFVSIDMEAFKSFNSSELLALIESKYSSNVLPKPSKTSCKWLMTELTKLCEPNTCVYTSILNLNSNVLGEYTDGQYSEITLPSS